MLDNSNTRPVVKLTTNTGFFSSEPTAGELIRRAIDIGFILVPYEDYLPNHNPNQREYAQAQNLFDFISKKDTSEKMLVVAGYKHIEEGARQNEAIPMAAYFTIISGINPLTIDQTEMMEGSTDAYHEKFYMNWLNKKPTAVSVIPVINEKAIDPFELNLYDIHVIHPTTKYVNERPSWLTMDGWKKEIPISPAYKSLFLVQAFYLKEYSEAAQFQIIPADQTYLNAANGYYYLYLHKGKYRLVFRDKMYEVLGFKDIEVN